MTDPLATLLHDLSDEPGRCDHDMRPPQCVRFAARLSDAGITLTQPQPDTGSLRKAAQAVVDFDPTLHDETDAAWIFPRLLDTLRAALRAAPAAPQGGRP